ncbi:MAG: hypothetical protein JW860_08400 [Sedimentisphaerales bacterium]|nr:hypothetical protein [Sedimentisphaerales bacterium]
MRYSWLVTMVFLVCVASLVLIGYGGDDSQGGGNMWEKDIQRFEGWDRQNAWPGEPVLFVGSSSIRMWQTRESFPKLPVMNRGFGGSQISDVNYFLERIVFVYKARLIVFYCGDNDIAGGKSAETVLGDYQTFVRRVQKELPETKIIYISIKPSGSRWEYWPEMERANKLIDEFCDKDERLFYVDGAGCLLGEDGKPKEELFLEDRLHMNAKGYEVWTGILRPVIEKAWKEGAD